MQNNVIAVKDIQYIYPDGTHALKGVSFKINYGESVAIVGSNGSGKTTLLSHFNGIYLPSSGTVHIGEHSINPNTLSHIRRTVGMVFQNPDDQLFMPTVYDDVAFGPTNLGLSQTEVELRTTTALKTVGAWELKDRPPYRLSGGQKRAASIAAVLAMEPSILAMDEPTAFIDPLTRRQLINLLKSFKQTKIIATHDLDMALDLCERTILLQSGSILADGPTVKIFRDKKLLEKGRLEQPLSMQGCPICSK
ncbi:energy-coupling factor ABC transporter ATP-binding protein [Dendrosporobacter sp. 1207_IL3150]|uniref:energy-coupling factor ABC transporter ATP-binding protein n=1 Tax=Dendrosporobacter sp. 1207_IL3150 TaxID=3084054 RepID=UPI002FDA5333